MVAMEILQNCGKWMGSYLSHRESECDLHMFPYTHIGASEKEGEEKKARQKQLQNLSKQKATEEEENSKDDNDVNDDEKKSVREEESGESVREEESGESVREEESGESVGKTASSEGTGTTHRHDDSIQSTQQFLKENPFYFKELLRCIHGLLPKVIKFLDHERQGCQSAAFRCLCDLGKISGLYCRYFIPYFYQFSFVPLFISFLLSYSLSY